MQKQVFRGFLGGRWPFASLPLYLSRVPICPMECCTPEMCARCSTGINSFSSSSLTEIYYLCKSYKIVFMSLLLAACGKKKRERDNNREKGEKGKDEELR